MLPPRYVFLAVGAYQEGRLSEGQLAQLLRVDRLEARRVAAVAHGVADAGEPIRIRRSTPNTIEHPESFQA
jgi:hypothetical protein